MEAIAAHCQRAEVLAVLSLDGVGAVHDAVRGDPGNFAAVMETRHLIKAAARELPNLGSASSRRSAGTTSRTCPS